MSGTLNAHLAMLQEEHRQALIGLVARLGEYIRKRETNTVQRLKSAQKKENGERAVELAAKLEVMQEIREMLGGLRKEFDVVALANRVLACAHLQGRSEADPTPEEIERKCQEIRAGWSESETFCRSNYKPQPVEMKETNFLGGGK